MLPASEEPGKTEVPRGGWALDGQDADMGRLRERLSLGAGVVCVESGGVGWVGADMKRTLLSRDKSLSQDSGRAVFAGEPSAISRPL